MDDKEWRKMTAMIIASALQYVENLYIPKDIRQAANTVLGIYAKMGIKVE